MIWLKIKRYNKWVTHNFNFIIIMSILVMQNNFLCNGIHTWRKKKSVVHLHSYFTKFVLWWIFFYFIFISIISSDTRTSKSLAVRFYLLVFFFHWFSKSFLLGIRFLFWLPLAYCLFKAFNWLARLFCSDKKNGFLSTIRFLFFVAKSVISQFFYYFCCRWLQVLFIIFERSNSSQ